MRTLRRPAITTVAAVALAVLAAGCGGAAPGWTYAPAPSATPIPSVEPSASASAAPSNGAGITLTAENIAFSPTELTVPAGEAFTIEFINNDPSIPHDVDIHEGDTSGPIVFDSEPFPGVETRSLEVPALEAGPYGFVCSVHPNMTGTLTAE